MKEDKTTTADLLWFYRLKQSGLFDAGTPQGEVLEASPLHDPHNCEGCRLEPCSWLSARLEHALRPTTDRTTPVT
jgi:hypothetical protein